MTDGPKPSTIPHNAQKPANYGNKSSILIIDDEAPICFAFERFFGARGYNVNSAGTGAEGVALARNGKPDVIFVDVRLPDVDGLDLLGELREILPHACIIVITAYGSLNSVTRAIREQAFECLAKPIDLDHAFNLVQQFLHARQTTHASETDKTAAINPAEQIMPRVIGNSAAMQEVFKSVARTAATDASVLITGETGTGKDIIARSIHQISTRCDKPFAAVNCGALPEPLVESELFGHRKGTFTGAEQDKTGRFETADSGTLFLDEIGELPLSSQVKLLRFLDSHTIERLGDVTPRHLDVRILAATNQPLAAALEQGQFRRDLYYRLAVIEIYIPPLRERQDDILPLARYFTSLQNPSKQPALITPQAEQALKSYAWPGNVRELRNAMEHALIMATDNPILPVHLPGHIINDTNTIDLGNEPAPTTLDRILDECVNHADTKDANLYEQVITPLEERLIHRVLEECRGNQSKAAAKLGIHRNTLRRKLLCRGNDY